METPNFLPRDVALPYGLSSDGRLVSVDAVVRGLKCECVCPGCKRPLVARKGEIIRAHFAHQANAACATGFESMVHLLAKDVIEKRRGVLIPEVRVHAGETRKHVAPAKVLRLTNI